MTKIDIVTFWRPDGHHTEVLYVDGVKICYAPLLEDLIGALGMEVLRSDMDLEDNTEPIPEYLEAP